MAEKSKFSDSGFILVVVSHALNHAYDALMPVLYPLLISEFNLQYSAVGLLVMAYRLTGGAFQLIMGFMGRFYKRKVLLGVGMIWLIASRAPCSVNSGLVEIFSKLANSGIFTFEKDINK